MKDRHVREMLSEYIDGMLSGEEASSVREHLDKCPKCREEYEDMLKIIGHMKEIDRLETPDFFLEKVHERMDKPSSLHRLAKGLFFPIKIKVPLELAGLAAAALLVIYIVGIRGKEDIYELSYVRRSQPPAVLQEETVEADTGIDEMIAHREKKPPESGFEGKKVEQRDKRKDAEEAIPPSKEGIPALAPQEKRMDKRAQVEDAVASSKKVKEEERQASVPQNERIERQTQIEADAPTVAKAQRKAEPGLEFVDKEKGLAEQDVLSQPTRREKFLEDTINVLGGKIIEREYNSETELLESLTIEIPANGYQELIEILEVRGDILKPYPVIKEKDQETTRVRIRLRN